MTPTEGLRDAEVQTARVADTVATEDVKLARLLRKLRPIQ